MDFETKLANYAKLLASYGLNVQEGQIVNISTEAHNRELALMVAEESYKLGAKYVDLSIRDPKATKLRVLHSKEEDLKFVMSYLSVKCEEIVDNIGANLALVSPEEPDLMSDADPMRLNILRKANYEAAKVYYDVGIDKNKLHWTVAAAATPKWGQKLFPEKSLEEAERALWEQIFTICRVDKENYLDFWDEHNKTLSRRAQYLNDLKIKEIYFTGPGTDLTVGLSEKALFKGGRSKSERGQLFEPNIPTEECFASPDYRKTQGKVSTTRPFKINGKLVKGLKLEFKDGVIVHAEAEQGIETFDTYRASDEGGSRLGEVALVGIDSPIYQSGLLFDEILYDENAACHIAIGSAYKNCIENGSNMKPEELEEIGCNESSVHTDMMISSEKVDVDVLTYSEDNIKVINKGEWTEKFL